MRRPRVAQLLLLAVTTETEDGVAIPCICVVVPPLPDWLPFPEDWLPPAALPVAPELPPPHAESNASTTATHAPLKIFVDIIKLSITQASQVDASLPGVRGLLKSSRSRTAQPGMHKRRNVKGSSFGCLPVSLLETGILGFCRSAQYSAELAEVPPGAGRRR
jgi:hypothetical protein